MSVNLINEYPVFVQNMAIPFLIFVYFVSTVIDKINIPLQVLFTSDITVRSGKGTHDTVS